MSLTETVEAPRPCGDHPMRASVARCGACGRPLCDDCYRFRMRERPACARCAYESSTRPARRVSLAAAFLGLSVGGAVYASRRYHLWDAHAVELVVGGVAALVAAVAIAASGRSQGPTVENREPDETTVEELPPPLGASPYRASVRRVVMAASPRVSASATGLVVLLSFAASAVLLPASLHLPRWLEAELVLGAWWSTVATVLSVLLYRGFRLRNDYVYFAPWNRPAKPDGEPAKPGGEPAKPGGEPAKGASKSSGSGCGDLAGCGCGDLGGCGEAGGEGVVVAIVVIVALGAAFGAAWVLVELALPMVFFVMYGLFMRAIGRVANDRHDCQGELSRAMGWGALWATVYVVPLALLTLALHVAKAHVR